MKKIIGVCGPTGAGKTYLANSILNGFDNTVHIDIDKIGHKVITYNDVINKLINAFGSDIIDNGIINRKKLSNIVFNSKECMAILTDITWSYMYDEIIVRLNNNKNKTVILDWQLLPLTELFDLCDLKILCNASKEKRYERIKQRDNISNEKIIERDNNSVDYTKYQFDITFTGNNYFDIYSAINISKVGLYAGSFDPITIGHIDIIDKASDLFDKVYVAVMVNQNKKTIFLTLDERIELINKIYKYNNKVEVITDNGATCKLALNNNVNYLIRGLRSSKDLDDELSLRDFNKDVANLETMYFVADDNKRSISSTALRFAYENDLPFSKYVDENVFEYLVRKKRI